MLGRAYLRILFSMEDFKGTPHPFMNCWSLSVEEWSYVCLSIMIFVMPANRRFRILTFTALAITFCAYKRHTIRSFTGYSIFAWQEEAYFGFPPLNIHWELGFITNAWKILVGALFRLIPWPQRLYSSRKLASLLTLLLILLIQFNGDYLLTRGYPFIWDRSISVDPLVSILTGFVIITSLHGNYILDNSTLRHIGRVSYSWYLWQWPLVDSVGWNAPTWSKVGATGLAFLFAHLSFTYVEEPVSLAYKAYKDRKAIPFSQKEF